jgi:hypothetical protein
MNKQLLSIEVQLAEKERERTLTKLVDATKWLVRTKDALHEQERKQ